MPDSDTAPPQNGYHANETHDTDADLSDADREEKQRLIKQVN